MHHRQRCETTPGTGARSRAVIAAKIVQRMGSRGQAPWRGVEGGRSPRFAFLHFKISDRRSCFWLCY